ncbi:response regulator aspartate phosphatase [Bacillus velezensis]
MDVNRTIPYDLVTQTLNDWYTLIHHDHVEQSEHISTEVDNELVNL